jgi:site-specific DNA-methyltransferase (adenine-specific)
VAQIRDLCHVVERENAAGGVFITLETPTRPMLQEAKAAGKYVSPLTGQAMDRIIIVTIADILQGKRLELPSSPVAMVRTAQRYMKDTQTTM